MPTARDFEYMHLALDLAKTAAQAGEVPVGALVVCDGKVVGQGWNQPISSADPCAHAEILALRAAAKALGNYRLPECELYVTLEPCTMCVGAMIHARIRRLVFAASEPKAGAVHSQARLLEAAHLNHRVNWEAGVYAEQAAAILQDFFRERREAKRQSRAQSAVPAPEESDLQIFINRKQDLPAFVRLNEAWIEKYFGLEPVDRELAVNPQGIVERGGAIFSLVAGERVAGVCALFRVDGEVYELARMAVAPEVQGNGFGEKLLSAAIEYARTRGVKKLRLLSNTKLQPAIALYKKHGFNTTATGQHPTYKRCNIIMEKDLA